MNLGTPRIQDEFSPLCLICGRTVDLKICKTDEHGNAVHEGCYAALVKAEEESVKAP
jgi:hypothetical protein